MCCQYRSTPPIFCVLLIEVIPTPGKAGVKLTIAELAPCPVINNWPNVFVPVPEQIVWFSVDGSEVKVNVSSGFT